MDTEELLAQLADIHLPTEVSYWPPAPGWWVLAVLVLAAGFYLFTRVRAARKQAHIRHHALAELHAVYANLANSDDNDIGAVKLRFVNAVNSVFRRVALYHFPHANVASLAGSAWVDFIRHNGDSSAMTDEIAEALSFGRFQTSCNVDAENLYQLGQQWVSSLYASKPAPQSSAETTPPTAQGWSQHA